MKGLINSVRFTIVMTDLFTMMGHTQANQEVNDGTYRSFNLSPFPISLLCCHSKQRSDLKITFANNSESRSSNRLSTNFPYLSIFSFQFMRKKKKKQSYDFFHAGEERSVKRYFFKFRAKFNSDKSLIAWIGKN